MFKDDQDYPFLKYANIEKEKHKTTWKEVMEAFNMSDKLMKKIWFENQKKE